jgi:hypothetical protein
MSTFKQAARATRAAGDALAAAGLSSRTAGEMLMAAGEVIGARVALGTVAMLNPAIADHAEFAKMLPEKTEAFAAAGTILTDRSMRAARYVAQAASNELSIAAAACSALVTCADPARALSLQTEYAAGWFGRTVALSMRLGAMALQAQGAAMGPVHRTATDNARRLRG